MGIDITRFKVVYNNRVLRALALMQVVIDDIDEDLSEFAWHSPTILEIIVIDEDGYIKVVRDEAKEFQFLTA